MKQQNGWRTPTKLRDRLTSAAMRYIGTPMEHGQRPDTLAFLAVVDQVIADAQDDAHRQAS
jgi:hypothetical protein